MATITGLTAERMLEIEAASVVDGEVLADHLILTKHDGTQIDAGPVVGPTGPMGPAGPATTVPSGVILDYAGASAPSGFLFCDGTSYLTADYPDLFAAIGYAYGGSGANFNVPDGRGRATIGKGTHADVDTLGDNDGLAVGSRRTKHKHTVTNPTYAAASSISPANMAKDSIRTVAGTTAVQGTSTGDGSYFANSGFYNLPVSTSVSLNVGGTVGPQTGSEPVDGPAYVVVNKIIKT